MNIGIIGTRGIPNQYGGFEQFTQFVAPALVSHGHEVSVYCPHSHPYKLNNWQGVQLIHKYDPENKLGTAGQFLYDLNCIRDSRKRKFDIILQLGYTSSSVWSFLFPKKTALVTNMDGLEWKRTKYSKPVRAFLRKAERWAATSSHSLIADSIGIQEYIMSKYQLPSTYIPYGATLFNSPDPDKISHLYISPYDYSMLIARMEPENNIETIITGYIGAVTNKPLMIIGSTANKFGTYLKNRYESNKIVFLGPLYNMQVLDNLRYYSYNYFHGHSVGGTNPSLLEAMASHCLIIAHDNVFNRSVLGHDGFFFKTAADISNLLNSEKRKQDYDKYLSNNTEKILNHYSWDHIVHLLENLLSDALQNFRQFKGNA